MESPPRVESCLSSLIVEDVDCGLVDALQIHLTFSEARLMWLLVVLCCIRTRLWSFLEALGSSRMGAKVECSFVEFQLTRRGYKARKVKYHALEKGS